MDLRSVDLHLLITLDVLLEDPHVTRAARKLQMSQPAVSHALARLRILLKDPLFVRTAKGFAPTNRAISLKEPVRNALRHVEDIFREQAAFNPTTSRDTFVIRMGDMNELLILPAITRALEQHAPRISLTVKHLPPLETIRGLDAGEITLAISAELEHPKSIRSVVLLDDEMVFIMRKDHPATKRPLTLKAYLELKHIKIAQTTSDMRLVDGYLSRPARQDTRVSIPHWLAAPALVESTNLVTSISRRMASVVNARGQFAVHSLPTGPQPFEWRLYWHGRYDSHPAHTWMRDLICGACQGLRTATRR